MDAALLTTSEFWSDPKPLGFGEIPDIPELLGHVLFETSGSSGTPKSVALSKKALLASATAVNVHLEVKYNSCWGLALPLNHVGGFGVVARAYQVGCGFEHFDQRWDPPAFHAWLADRGITHTSLVPTQVHDLVKSNLTAPVSLTAIVVGGGHLDTATGQAARDLGWPVLASYGMTEAGSQIATQGLELLGMPYQPLPISLLPIWEAKITHGDLLNISGPALFSGYLTAGIFTPRKTDWHITADRAALDCGQLTLLGRADTLVKILGELVDPEAVERELFTLSRGRLTPGTFAVIAIPDARAGNALVPLFESSVQPAMIEETLSLYHAQSPGYRRLRPAEKVGEFPRSALGKLRREELTALYQNQIAP